MSKPVAKKAAPKAVAKTSAKVPVKVSAKAPVKPLAKSPVKSAAKPMPAPNVRAGTKAGAKATAKPAQKAPTQPAAKQPAKQPATPPAKSPIKADVAAPKAKVAPAPTPAPTSAVKSATLSQPKTNAITKPASKTANKSETHRTNPAPAPVAAPITNRFTDRFAPARPTKKTEHEPMEAIKSTAKVDPKLANAWKTKAGKDLSVAELMAMPDDVYMNDKQLEFFRAMLRVQRDDLLSNAGETTEHLREDTTITPDPADRATIEEEHALELRTRDRERKLLKKIAQSLTRVESGEYGYCDETGEPIGLARLMARPTATLSLEAQQRREMKQKMFGD